MDAFHRLTRRRLDLRPPPTWARQRQADEPALRSWQTRSAKPDAGAKIGAGLVLPPRRESPNSMNTKAASNVPAGVPCGPKAVPGRAGRIAREESPLGLRDSLLTLMERATTFPHDYRPSILSFLEIDIKKISKDLNLSERGRERGRKNEPPADSEIADDVEHEILEFIDGEVKKAHAALLDDLSTYAQRLHALDLEGRLSTIEAAAMDGISSFRSEVSRGRDRLSLLRRRLQELEKELHDFRVRHGLERPAHYPPRPGMVLRWGLIALLFLFEVLGNTYFLAKGSEYGLIGGFSEAVIIAFLNIGMSMSFGFFGLRQCWHRSSWRKMAGFLSLVGWLLFALTFNLLVAHYREASGAFLEGGGEIALRTLKADPLGLTEFQSWVLFGIGALFSFIAFADAFSMDDPYPFYGKLYRTVDNARLAYVEERDALIAQLEDLKSGTVEAMLNAKDDLAKRRGEHASIFENRTRALRAYDQHLAYLERAANALLSVYREANREARTDPPPRRFGEPWKLTPPPVEAGLPPGTFPPDKLDAAVVQAQATLDQRMREVHDEFERAFRAYRLLDEVVGGEHVEATAAA